MLDLDPELWNALNSFNDGFWTAAGAASFSFVHKRATKTLKNREKIIKGLNAGRIKIKVIGKVKNSKKILVKNINETYENLKGQQSTVISNTNYDDIVKKKEEKRKKKETDKKKTKSFFA